ncbi:hypothetical protein [Anaerovorax odorimutans]|uniref:hypothetical protein n=1 Tax=Anaerovorax odorimutans TaxID=109327 RepID=UPI0004801917|nr:hypothetical protein [Anaerovorax odorimutans]
MLTKLIKYDIKSTWRDFTGVYLAILLGVILIPLIINNISNGIINFAAGFIAFAIIISVIAIMIVNLFKIFNTNIFSKEGYLTMTLPVKTTQIVFSKLLVSTMWMVLTGIVSIVGLIIFIGIGSPEVFSEFINNFDKIISLISSKSLFSIIIVTLAIILSSVKEIAKLFLACSIAHLKQLNRFRIVIGIISYFFLSWLESFILQIIEKVIVIFSPNAKEWLDLLISSQNNVFSLETFNAIIGIGIIYGLVIITAYICGIIWILNNKLELD